MKQRIPQSKEKLEEILQHTWKILREYCEKFDAGDRKYALQMAGEIRKLVKDTSRSVSLLGQLGLKNVPFFSTSKESTGGMTIGAYSNLFCMPMGGDTECIPYLDDSMPNVSHSPLFEEWWEEIVLTDATGQKFSRKNLIEFMAEQAGGVHADPEIDSEYETIVGENPMGALMRENGGPNLPIVGADTAVVRQVAHELFRTFFSDEPKRKMITPVGLKAALGPVMLLTKEQVESMKTQKAKKIGRNEPCPCGALRDDGKPMKYKKCHGA